MLPRLNVQNLKFPVESFSSVFGWIKIKIEEEQYLNSLKTYYPYVYPKLWFLNSKFLFYLEDKCEIKIFQ